MKKFRIRVGGNDFVAGMIRGIELGCQNRAGIVFRAKWTQVGFVQFETNEPGLVHRLRLELSNVGLEVEDVLDGPIPDPDSGERASQVARELFGALFERHLRELEYLSKLFPDFGKGGEK